MKFLKVLLAALILTVGANTAISYAGNWIQSNMTVSTQAVTPTSGQTITANTANRTWLSINPASTLATLTIALPSGPKDGDVISVFTSQKLTSITYTNGTIYGGVASMSANTAISYTYFSTVGAWEQNSGIGGIGGLDKITAATGTAAGAIVRATTGDYSLAQTTCALFSDATTCAKQMGYADPRAFGAYCSSNFNANNSTEDDAAGIQAALNTGVPVMIPYPGCKLANKINMPTDGATIFSFAQGGKYNSNYPGNPYIFLPNALWDNRATSLNCAIDTQGYDNVTLRNITMRSNYYLVGSVGVCDSYNGGVTPGLRNGRAAAFLNLENVSFLNMGNGVGSSMIGYFDDNGGSQYGSSAPCTPTDTSYGTRDLLRTNVLQVRAKGVDVIGNCMGFYGNLSDVHMTDFYGANIFHNVFASLAGYGSGWDLNNLRIEYSGLGTNGSTIFYNDGAGLYLDAPYGVNVTNLTCDHQRGPCWKTGPNAKMVSFNNVNAIDSGYGSLAGITDKAHFVIDGSVGVSATNICTRKNVVDTPYVLVTRNTPNFVTWNGCGGASGTSVGIGGWSTSYFNLVTTPTHFDYCVNSVGCSRDTSSTFKDMTLVQYTETAYDIGNSSTAFTISLANGTFQKVTATGNATVTMPTATAGKSFTLRYYTGAGSFTAAFTGVKWSGGSAPTLTATASRMDVFSFISDGTNWYGSVVQNYIP